MNGVNIRADHQSPVCLPSAHTTLVVVALAIAAAAVVVDFAFKSQSIYN